MFSGRASVFFPRILLALTQKLSNMPEWSGNLLDPVRSAELVAARWGGKASYDKPEAPLTEAGMRGASQED